MALNLKQQKFAEEYAVDRNGTKATIRAGYSAKTAHVQASRLLGNVKIMAEIRRLTAAQTERTEITADRILEEYARIAFANLTDYTDDDVGSLRPLSELTAAEAAALSEIRTTGSGEVKIKLHDKLKALDALARHIGLDAPTKIEATTQFDLSGLTVEELKTLRALRAKIVTK